MSAPDERAREARLRELEEHLAALRAHVRVKLGARLRTKESSQDLVQSICREVLADLDRFEPRGPTSFRDWLLAAAEHKILDKARFWRRARRDAARELPLDEHGDDAKLLAHVYAFATPSQAAVERETLERLERAFRELPAEYREAIVLSRVHGLSGVDLASRLGRTEGAARTLLSRALARLALVMQHEAE
jgi:RNA polymerase sigma factor (sigma-70 family)